MYSSSVSSLNNSYRYSIAGGGAGINQDARASSEEKTPKKSLVGHYKYSKSPSSSNYDNMYISSGGCTTPLLSRKNKQHQIQPKMCKPPIDTLQQHNLNIRKTKQQQQQEQQKQQPSLYDRRLNRSFEAAQGLVKTQKSAPLRRSTPHLFADDEQTQHKDSARNSATSSWCCGNFVLKQWRKMNNYD